MSPGRVHFSQEHKVRSRALAHLGCGRQSSGDNKGIRVRFLDGLMRHAQELHVLFSARRSTAPFAVQVGLIPDLIGLNAPLVASGEPLQKYPPIVKIIRWTGAGKQAIASRPAWLIVNPRDDLQARVLSRFDECGSGSFHSKSPCRCPDVAPLEALLDSCEPGVPREPKVSCRCSRIAPEERVYGVRWTGDSLDDAGTGVALGKGVRVGGTVAVGGTVGSEVGVTGIGSNRPTGGRGALREDR